MRRIVTWMLSILLAFAFLAAGLGKLSGQPMMAHEFAEFGLPLWFMYFTGVLELAGALLVLFPRAASLGAGVLACVMVGALFEHLTHGQAAMIGAPSLLLVVALAVGTLRGWAGRPASPSGSPLPKHTTLSTRGES